MSAIPTSDGDAVEGKPWKLAVAQVPVVRGDAEGNVERCVGALDEAGARGARLLVLPECVVTGYAFDDREATTRAAVELEDTVLEPIRRCCAASGIHCVLGLVERRDGDLYNTAVLFDDRGELVGEYRKVHLPCLGADRFTVPGERASPVIATEIGRIAINICYDIRFPECARMAAIEGADVIAHPANWPTEAAILPEQFAIVRAAENRIFMAAANRGDSEGGIEFAGMSRIVDPSGRVLAKADREPAILVADVDLAASRTKRSVRQAGLYETDVFAHRRPDLYGRLGLDV